MAMLVGMRLPNPRIFALLVLSSCSVVSGLDKFEIGQGGAAGSTAEGGAGGEGGAPVCGDGVRTGDEECDDGRNGDEMDGCTDMCVVSCPPNWRKNAEAHCFGLRAMARNWEGASTHCRSLGEHVHLATLTTDAERMDAAAILEGASAWVGGNDLDDEGVWVWENSEPWSWELYQMPPWLSPDEPTNTNDEDCLQVLETGLFNDAPCLDPHLPLCELSPPG